LFAVFLQLLIQRTQKVTEAQRQLAFGFGNSGRGFELIGSREDSQALFRCFRAPQFVLSAAE